MPDLEKYKVVQFFSVQEDRNEEDYKFFFRNFIPWIEIIVNF